MSEDRSTDRSRFFRIRNSIAAKARASAAAKLSIDGHGIRPTAENETLIEILQIAEAEAAYAEHVQGRMAA